MVRCLHLVDTRASAAPSPPSQVPYGGGTVEMVAAKLAGHWRFCLFSPHPTASRSRSAAEEAAPTEAAVASLAGLRPTQSQLEAVVMAFCGVVAHTLSTYTAWWVQARWSLASSQMSAACATWLVEGMHSPCPCLNMPSASLPSTHPQAHNAARLCEGVGGGQASQVHGHPGQAGDLHPEPHGR